MARVLIASFVPSFAYKVALCLHEVGAVCHLIGETRVPYGAISRVVARSTRIKTRRPSQQPDAAIAELNAYCARHRIDVVMAADFIFTSLFAHHPDRIQAKVMPLADGDLLGRLHNKWGFAQALRAAELPSPPTRLLTRHEDIDALDLDWPLIVKPLGMSDSLGVKKIDNPAALRAHASSGVWGTGYPLLVQSFIEGQDIDLNFLADHGEIIAWSVQSRTTYRAHALRFTLDEEVVQLGRAIVAATGFHGVGHFDLRRGDDGRLYPIELNPRFWGSVQYSAWMGVNFPALVLKMALGVDVRSSFRPVEGLCDHIGLQPRMALNALRQGRLAPDGLSAGTRAGFLATHADPLPHVLRRAAELVERVPALASRSRG